jgi:hypothetical protein
MYFKNADYSMSAKYYDSTLVKLDPKTREFIHIQKTRKNLDEVIKYEDIAKRNDSILKIVSLPQAERTTYFDDYIVKLKKQDEAKRILEEKQKETLANIERNSKPTSSDINSNDQEVGKSKKPGLAPPTMNNVMLKETGSVFYFYNPSTVAFGKLEFKKMWGEKALKGNWRLPVNGANIKENDTLKDTDLLAKNKVAQDTIIEKYTTAFYLNQIPTSQTEIDSISKERNFAYYQLGIIYKEKYKEYALATSKLEKVLKQNPEEKLVLPSMYNLYKIYQITDANKAAEMQNKISIQFPNSRYAQIINNSNETGIPNNESPEAVYNKWYKKYQAENYMAVLEKSDDLIHQFSGDEIVSKFELLKANSIGKLQGLNAYKKALQEVADNYPNSEEGKNAQEIINSQIPSLEKMDFNTTDTKSWKILYKVGNPEDKNTKEIEAKIKQFIAEENLQKLTYSYDIYTEKENLITIHGVKSELYANDIAMVLKENKKFKITEPAIVVSKENYNVIQIKKNLNVYVTSKKQ